MPKPTITYTFRNSEGKTFEVEQSEFDAHQDDYIRDNADTEIRMRGADGDYAVPLRHYKEALADGYHAFTTKHGYENVQPQQQTQTVQEQPQVKPQSVQEPQSAPQQVAAPVVQPVAPSDTTDVEQKQQSVQQPAAPKMSDAESMQFYTNAGNLAMGALGKSNRVIANVGRVGQQNTLKGQQQMRANKTAVRTMGGKTETNALYAPPVSQMQSDGGQAPAVNAEQKGRSVGDTRGPQPYGVEYNEAGEAVTVWQLPDGSLTSDQQVAGVAGGVARRNRLTQSFNDRMWENGLDPEKPEDVRQQQRNDVQSIMEKDETSRGFVDELVGGKADEAMQAAQSAFDKTFGEIGDAQEAMPSFANDSRDRMVQGAVRTKAANRDYMKAFTDWSNAMVSNLENKLQSSRFVDKLVENARNLGVDPSMYMQQIGEKAMNSLQEQLTNKQVEKYMPKSDAEYIMRGVQNSIAGMIQRALYETGEQAAYRDMAMGQYGEQTSGWTQAANMGVTFMADAPFFGLTGKISGAAVQQIAERQIVKMVAEGMTREAAQKAVAAAARASFGTRVAQKVLQGSVGGAVNLGAYNMLNETARQTAYEEPDVAGIVREGAKGVGTGAALGLAGGVIGAASADLTGAAKLGSKVAGFGTEAAVFATADRIYNNIAGEENSSSWTDDFIKSAMNLAVMKATSPGVFAKPVEATIKGLSYAAEKGRALKEAVSASKEGKASTFVKGSWTAVRDAVSDAKDYVSSSVKDAMRSENDKSGAFKFESDEIEDLKKSRGAQDLMEALTGMESEGSQKRVRDKEIDGARNGADVLLTDENGNEVARQYDFTEEQQRAQQAYADVMKDPEVTFRTKQKLAQFMGDETEHAVPDVMDYTTDEEGGRYTVTTRDAEGNAIDRETYDMKDAYDERLMQLQEEITQRREQQAQRREQQEGNAEALRIIVGRIVRDGVASEDEVLTYLRERTTGNAERDAVLRAYIMYEAEELAKNNAAREQQKQSYKEGKEAYAATEQKLLEQSVGVDGEQGAEGTVAPSARKTNAVDNVVQRMHAARQEVDDVFGDDAEMRLSELADDPWRLVNDPTLSVEQRSAVLEYINANAALEGVMAAADESVEGKKKQKAVEIDNISHKDWRYGEDGSAAIIPVTLAETVKDENGIDVVDPLTFQPQHKRVYLVKGNAVMSADGSGMVDKSKSDSDLLVYDPETGETAFVYIDDIMGVGKSMSSAETLQQAYAEIDAEKNAVVGSAQAIQQQLADAMNNIDPQKLHDAVYGHPMTILPASQIAEALLNEDGRGGAEGVERKGVVGSQGVLAANMGAIAGAKPVDLQRQGITRYVSDEMAERYADEGRQRLVNGVDATIAYRTGETDAHDYLVALGLATGEGSWLDSSTTTSKEIAERAEKESAKYAPYIFGGDKGEQGNLGSEGDEVQQVLSDGLADGEYTLTLGNGERVRATIKRDALGGYDVDSDKPIKGGQTSNYFTLDELQGLSPLPTSPEGDEVTEMSDDVNDTDVTATADATQTIEPTEEPVEGEPERSALERMPQDEKGQPNFDDESVDVDTAWDALVEKTQDEDIAQNFAEAMVKAKKAALKKAEKATGADPTDIDAFIAAEQQRKASIAAAQAQVERWNSIAETTKRRAAAEEARKKAEAEMERKAALEAEARRKAEAEAQIAEQKKVEAEKQAAQEAVGAYAVGEQIKEKWAKARKTDGARDVKVLPDGTRLTGHYVLTEAGATTASHDIDNAFAPTEGFPVDEKGLTINDRDYERDKDAQAKVYEKANTYDGRALQNVPTVSPEGVVYDGANRTMSGDMAARNGTDGSYLSDLEKYASKFGLTPEQVAEYEHPRVSFVLDEALPYDAQTFARFNAQEKKSQSKSEAAVKMGKVVDEKTFVGIASAVGRYDSLADFYGDKKASVGALMDLVHAGVVSDMELPALTDGEGLSGQGRDVLENVLVGKVFEGNGDAVRHLSSHSGMRRAVVLGMSEIAHNRALKNGYGLGDELAAAIDLVARAKQSDGNLYKEGNPVSSYGRQQGLFDDEMGDSRVTDATTLILADILNSGKPSELRKVLATYNSEGAQASAGQLDLLSGEVRSKEDILTDVNRQYGNGTAREKQQMVDRAIAERKQRAAEQSATGGEPLTETVAGGAAVRAGAGELEQAAAAGAGGGQSARTPGSTTEGQSALAQAEERVKDKLSDEKDEYGKPFIKSQDGGVDFGQIDEESELTSAPIRLSIGENRVDEDGKNHGYGLLHIEAGHGEQIRNAGYNSVEEFVEEVAKNYDTIREGNVVADNQTYLLELTDGHKNTLFIELSKDGSYWNVNSAGIFRERYSRKKRIVSSVPTMGASSRTEADGVNHGHEDGATVTSGNSPLTDSSEGKVTDNSGVLQEKSVKSSPIGATSSAEHMAAQRGVVNTEPTEGQKKAGNYKKGHVRVDGYDITIENPKGSVRSGKDADNKEWSVEMKHDYGYIKGRKTVDGDDIDVYLSDTPDSGKVYVVDQVDQKTGAFDEHKVMYGFGSKEEAIQAYRDQYEEGWKVGPVTEVSREEFKKWVESSKRKTKPFSEYVAFKSEERGVRSEELAGVSEGTEGAKPRTSMMLLGTRYDNVTYLGERDGKLLFDLGTNTSAYDMTRDQAVRSMEVAAEDKGETIDAGAVLDAMMKSKGKEDAEGEKGHDEPLSETGDSKAEGPIVTEAHFAAFRGGDKKAVADAKRELYVRIAERFGKEIEYTDAAIVQARRDVRRRKEKSVKGSGEYSLYNYLEWALNDIRKAAGYGTAGTRKAARKAARKTEGADIEYLIERAYRLADEFDRRMAAESAGYKPSNKAEAERIASAKKSIMAAARELFGVELEADDVKITRMGDGNYAADLAASEGGDALIKAMYDAPDGVKSKFREALISVQNGLNSGGAVQKRVGGAHTDATDGDVRRRAADAAVEALRDAGVDVSMDLQEMSEALGGDGVQMQAKVGALAKAANAVRSWVSKGKRGKAFTLELPRGTQDMIRRAMGRDFDSHNITANGVAHAKKNHGENGMKLTESSIPLRDEDFELIPYIMTSPDRVEKSSTDVSGRTSMRFYKDLHNGYVVVAEKEYKNSPDDMETITMWAEKTSSAAINARSVNASDTHVRNAIRSTEESSSDVSDARRDMRPQGHVRNVIISTEDAAKIRKDAENAIVREGILQKLTVYHGTSADFDHFDHSHMGEGEGAQVYGWGTYVTEVDGIARGYSMNAMKEENEKLYNYRYDIEQAKGSRDALQKELDEIASGVSIKERADHYQKRLDVVKERMSTYPVGSPQYERDASIVRNYERKIQAELSRLNEPENYVADLKARIAEAEQAVAVKEKELADYEQSLVGKRHYYTVEIPDDRGDDYLDWDKKVEGGVAEKIVEGMYDYMEPMLDERAKAWVEQGKITKVDALQLPMESGENLYNYIGRQVGSDKDASLLLNDMGIVGIRYPAEYRSGGREDQARNYVIFKEEDAKIVNKTQFLKTRDGEVYGFVKDGRVYLDPEVLDAESPVHEYTHLWDTSLRKKNPELWKRGVELMKQTALWDEVMNDEGYADIKDDEDLVASEVHSRLSGAEGKALFEKMARKVVESDGDLMGKAEKISVLERLREWVKEAWQWVKDTMSPWTKDEAGKVTLEEFVRMPLRDLLNGKRVKSEERGVRSEELSDGADGGVLQQRFIGERGAERADRYENATKGEAERRHRMDNLAVAREMEKAKKDARAIKLATGWERGADGKWRYEERDAKINQDAVLEHHDYEDVHYVRTELGELLNDERLFAAYPELKGMPVVFQPLPRGEQGAYYPADIIGPANIVLSKDYLGKRENPEWRKAVEAMEEVPVIKRWSETMDAEDFDEAAFEKAEAEFKASPWWEKYNALLKGEGDVPKFINGISGEDVILHEVQHAVQHAEGFAQGGNEYTYRNRLGELKEKSDAWAMIEEFIDKKKELGDGASQMDAYNALRNEYHSLGMTYGDGFMPSREAFDAGFNLWVRGYDKEGYEDAYNEYHRLLNKFGTGASDNRYRNLAGEVESRNVQSRMGLTEEQRRNSLRTDTQDVSDEDQIFLYGAGVSAMGSKTNRKMRQIGNAHADSSLTEQQKTVVDTYAGLIDGNTFEVDGRNGRHVITMIQGNETGRGTKHSLYRHYETDLGWITDEDVVKIPDVIKDGDVEARSNRKRLYKLTADGVTYKVVTQMKGGREEFVSFSTNRNAPNPHISENTHEAVAEDTMDGAYSIEASVSESRSNTSEDAPHSQTDALSGGKVTEKSSSVQGNAEKKDDGVRFRDGEGDVDATQARKEAQLAIINEYNPMLDDYHTGIRKASDIKTFDEMLDAARNGDWAEYGEFAYPDIDMDMLEEAKASGYITVYSSYPIEQGVFVTPSRMNASDYSGGKRPYSKRVRIDDVAWINEEEGQLAIVDESSRGSGDGDVRFRFIGEKGAERADMAEERTHRMDNLDVARDMEEDGKDARSIKLATGWERGADGKWRYEAQDFDVNGDALVRLRNKAEANKGQRNTFMMLKELIGGDDALFKEYPELANARIKVEAGDDDITISGAYVYDDFYGDVITLSHGALDGFIKPELKAYGDADRALLRVKQGYNPWTGEKIVDEVLESGDSVKGLLLQEAEGQLRMAERKVQQARERSKELLRGVLVHEVQHAVQRLEGFARGGNVYQVQKDVMALYDKAGEALDAASARAGKSRFEVLDDDFHTEDAELQRAIADFKKYQQLAQGSAFDSYQVLAGEVEARNVQSRMKLGETRRMRKLRTDTQDVSDEDQIFLYGDGENDSVLGTIKRKAERYMKKGQNNERNEEAASGNNDSKQSTYIGGRVDRETLAGGERASDRSDIQVFEQGLVSERSEHRVDSERNRRSAETSRLIDIAKKNGRFLPLKEIGKEENGQGKRTGESMVYVDEANGIVTKVKDPYAKSAMKHGVEPEDAIYEHIVHNMLFPETAYHFEGISEDNGDLRIVLSQQLVKSVRKPSARQIEEALAAKGLYREDGYSFGNDFVSVTDVEGDNVIEGKDGKLYFIDPIIRYKKPVREILDRYTGVGEDEKQPQGSTTLPITTRGTNFDGVADAKLKEFFETAKQAREKVTEKYWDVQGNDGENTDPVVMRDHAQHIADELHTSIRLITDEKEISTLPTARHRRSKGWADITSGGTAVTIVVPNNEDVADIENTAFHEIVAHHGLRKLVGEEKMDGMLDEIYGHAEAKIRGKIDERVDRMMSQERERLLGEKRKADDDGIFAHAEAVNEAEGKREQFTREATEEYMAEVGGKMGKEGFEKMEKEELTFWQLVKQKVMGLLNRLLAGKKWAKNIKITDDDIRYILFRSYQNLKNGGKASVMDAAEDVVMREETRYNDGVTASSLDQRIALAETSAEHGFSNYSDARQWAKQNIARTYSDAETQGKGEIRISGKAIDKYLSEAAVNKSVSRDAHLSVLRVLPEVLGNSLDLEQHEDRRKGSDGVRSAENGTNANVLIHRLYGGVKMDDGNVYRVKITVKEDRTNAEPKKAYSYEVKEIELLAGLHEEAVTSSRYSNSSISVANLVNNVVSDKENGRKITEILKEEEKMMFRDGDMGLDEFVTKMKTELATKNADDLKAKTEAYKAIGGNLQKLRQAMARQREYDEGTVKQLADLAQVMLDGGLLDKLSAFETKRVLSTLKNGVGKQDLTGSVDNLMDIMVKNQLRRSEDTWGRLLRMRRQRVNGSGVVVQGTLDADGQALLGAVNRYKGIVKLEDLDAEIGELMNRMGDADETVARNAAVEYGGAMIARRYVDSIVGNKEHIKMLRRELARCEEDYKAGRKDYAEYSELKRETAAAIRDKEIERVEAYNALIEQLGGAMGESMERAKAWRDGERERVKKIQHFANSDMEGRELKGQQKDTWVQRLMNSALVELAMKPLADFHQYMRMFGRRSGEGQGYLYNHFMRGWVDAADGEQVWKERYHEKMDAKAAELFGQGKNFMSLYDVADSGVSAVLTYYDGSRKREYELGQGQLLYLYAVEKMGMGRATNRNMGFTEEVMMQVEAALDPRLKAYADWVQEELLPEMGAECDKVHVELFGAHMDQIENYFPFVRDKDALKREVVNGEGQQPNNLISVTTGAIKKRQASVAVWDMPNVNFLDVLARHVTDMCQWANYARLNKDLGTLLSYNHFKQQVKGMTTVMGGGDRLWRDFSKSCAIVGKSYQPETSSHDKAMTRLTKSYATSKIAFRPFTAMKQALSLPAFAGEIDPRYYFSKTGMTDAGTVGLTAIKWAWENLPNYRKRIKSRTAGDYRLRETEYDTKIMKAAQWGMLPNIGMDAWTIAVGAHGVYMTKKAKYMRLWGMSEAEADKRAKQDATICFNKSQQSSEGPFMAPVQVDHTLFASTAMLFRNASKLYTAEMLASMRNVARMAAGLTSREFTAKQWLRTMDPEHEGEWTEAQWEKAREVAAGEHRRAGVKNVVNAAMFGWILPWLWRLGGVAPLLLLSSDEDEKHERADEALSHSYFGPAEGLLYGDVATDGINMLKDWAGGKDVNFANVGRSAPIVSDLVELWQDVKKDQVVAAQELANFAVSMGLGVNPQTLTDWVVASMDAFDDRETQHEFLLWAARVLNVPQSQTDRMYFDELDMDALTASRLTPMQLAERYARYKRRRQAPMTGWMYSEEGSTKAEGKYKEKALTAAKESVDRKTDGEDRKALEQWRAEYKEVRAKVQANNKLYEEDAVRANKELAELEKTAAYRRYDIMNMYDSEMRDVSKRLLWTEDRQEREELVDVLVMLKREMVKQLREVK